MLPTTTGIGILLLLIYRNAVFGVNLTRFIRNFYRELLSEIMEEKMQKIRKLNRLQKGALIGIIIAAVLLAVVYATGLLGTTNTYVLRPTNTNRSIEVKVKSRTRPAYSLAENRDGYAFVILDSHKDIIARGEIMAQSFSIYGSIRSGENAFTGVSRGKTVNGESYLYYGAKVATGKNADRFYYVQEIGKSGTLLVLEGRESMDDLRNTVKHVSAKDLKQ